LIEQALANAKVAPAKVPAKVGGGAPAKAAAASGGAAKFCGEWFVTIADALFYFVVFSFFFHDCFQIVVNQITAALRNSVVNVVIHSGKVAVFQPRVQPCKSRCYEKLANKSVIIFRFLLL
jgi:hypothetical protein